MLSYASARAFYGLWKISKVAKTVEEACALVEAGYEYVTEFKKEGIKSSENASSAKQDVYRGCVCGAGE